MPLPLEREPLNVYGRIARYFLTNGKLSLLLFVMLFAWGLVSYALIPKQYNPDIVAPAFLIRAEAPGHTAAEVYELVTKPMEDVVHEIPGVEDVLSRSVHGGVALTTVRFYVGEDREDSMIILQQRLSSNLDLKPVGVIGPAVRAIDPEDLPVMTLALRSESRGPVELRRVAQLLKDDLKHVSGVSIVKVVGGRRREFRLELDPARMRASKTGMGEISSALERTSVLSALGPIKGEALYTPVELSSNVASIEELEDLVIATNADFDLTAADIGAVEETQEERESVVSWTTAAGTVRDAVLLSIAKREGANIVPLSRELRAAIKALEANAPYLKDARVEIIRDEGRVAEEEISGLMRSLIQAVLVVFAVLLVFLSTRAALIVALSVPLTLMAVIGAGLLAGYTLNRITLFALILSLGLLVDSATVVVENIVRRKRIHPDKPMRLIVPFAVSEIGNGLMLSTLTTVLAFIPMAFVTGMMGPYMGPIPFFVPAALIAALLLAYTLNPWLAAVLCQGGAPEAHALLERLYLFGHRMLIHYENMMEWLLIDRRRRRNLLAAGAGLLIAALLLPALKLVQFRMLPKADRNQVYIYLDLDRGSSLERTEAAAQQVAQALQAHAEVVQVLSFAGTPPVLDFNGLFKGAEARGETHQATLRVNLKHHEERQIRSEELAVAFRRMTAAALKPYSDARFQIIEDPPGPPVQSTFLLKVKGRDPALLRATAEDLETKLKGIKGLKDLDTSLDEPLEKVLIEVDRRKAAMARVSTAQIAEVLRTFYEGARIGILHDADNREQEYIVMRLPRALRRDLAGLGQMTLSNDVGNPVPVTEFLSAKRVPAEEDILSDNRRRTVYISGEMERRSVTYAAMDAWKLLRAYRLPGGDAERVSSSPFGAVYRTPEGESVRVELGGEWELTLEVFRDLGLAMAVAVFLIYFVLVMQFSSFRIPLTIMGTIPLALIGVLPGFALLFAVGRVYFSATSMIGVIALAGIVVNNAIILMEYLLQLRARSKKPLLYVLIVSCKTRVRPIVLTSITTILGTLMIVTDPVWSGLAWSIVFGLSLSTALTLVFFPVMVMHFSPEAATGDGRRATGAA